MNSPGSNRRLAAIIFTDIAGYTLMMQRDEAEAMDAVRKHHSILERCVPEHHGTIQQYYGDGSLSLFNSATDAVDCAWQLQKAFLEQPEVPVRVGIHIGEIRMEEGKIFGDGVNVASRIESIGQPGTVLFSRDVYEKVRNHSEFQISKLGRFEFKNVDDPIEVYALTNPDLRTPDPRKIEGKLKAEKKRSRRQVAIYITGLLIAIAVAAGLILYPNEGASNDLYRSSIAVLPFENLSQDTEQAFLSSGIAEDILTQLAQIRELKVIARESSMRVVGDGSLSKSPKEIGKELDVENLLMGSVRRFGDVVKVTARLVNTRDENIIWAENFTDQFENLLNLQQDIAMTVSDRLKIRLSPEVKRRFDDKVQVNPEAYELYLRGREAILRSSGSQDEVERAMGLFEKAIAADSTFAKAWVGLADSHLEAIFWHRTADSVSLPIATRAANKALKLDPGSGEAYAALGAVDMCLNNLREAKLNIEKALELNPNYSFAHERMAWIYFYSGNLERAFEYAETALKLDPLSTRYQGGLINAYYWTGEFDKGIKRVSDYLSRKPDDNFLLWALAYMYAGRGDYEKSIETLDKRTIGRKTNWVYAYNYGKLGRKEEAREILDTLIARDNRGFVPDFMMAAAYVANGENDNAIARLEQASGLGGESFFAWGLHIDPMFEPLHGDPRFDAIVERIRKIYNQ